MTEDLRTVGEKMRRKVMGDAHVDRALKNVDEFSKPNSDHALQFCWGVWGRPELDLRSRSMIMLSMLAAMNRINELKLHIRGALRNGVTRVEIREIFLQTTAYAGVPAGAEGMRAAKEIFAEEEFAEPAAVKVEAQSIAFIGLGVMGKPMARCLVQAGHDVRVFDLSKDTLGAVAAEIGAVPANTIHDAVRGAQFVVTMLPDSRAVEAALFSTGADGRACIQSMQPGATVIDMSSSDPISTRDIAAKLLAAKIRFVDAPVSGGRAKAETGKLSIMVGGDENDVAHALPVLQGMGESISHVGPVGAGHATKALNNYVSATGLIAASEALQIAERFNLDRARVNEALDKSSGFNSATRDKIPRNILSGKFGPGFTMKLMKKDIGIAMSLANSVNYDAKLGNKTLQIYEDAFKALASEKTDNTEIYKYLDQDDATSGSSK